MDILKTIIANLKKRGYSNDTIRQAIENAFINLDKRQKEILCYNINNIDEKKDNDQRIKFKHI